MAELELLMDRVRDDSTAVADMLRWAHVLGYSPQRVDRDRPTGPGVVEDEDPDRVRGDRFDLGVGSHRARTAIVAVAPWVRTAELATFTALRSLGPTDLRRCLARPSTDPDTLAAACDGTLAAVKELRRLLVTDELAASRNRPKVRGATKALDRAWKSLSNVFTDRADLPEGVAVPNCLVCEIRPRAEDRQGRATQGGRCETCARFRKRSFDGRQERPRSLDKADAADARVAAERRRERGDGWGDESLSATSTPPVHVDAEGPPDGLGIRAAADLLGVDWRTVRHLVASGELESTVWQSRTYIDRHSLRVLIGQAVRNAG